MRGFFSFAFVMLGVILLAISLVSSITTTGSQFVNLSLIHVSLSLQIWGFGIICIGLLLGRPPAPKA